VSTDDRASLWRATARRQAGADYAHRYAERFAELAASGADVHGEAALIAGRLDPGARVLDAGCGTGRVAVRLAELGFDVVGVDVDPAMVAVARERHPDLTWAVADLAELDLGTRVDAVVMAGNVVPFVTAPLVQVLTRLVEHLHPGGLLVCGYGLDPEHLPAGARTVPLAAYDEAADAAGLRLVDRLAGWDGTTVEGTR
jgi:SAM-dependent methyltransferase